MADYSIMKPLGVLYNVLVKVDLFIFSTNFVILDFEIDHEIPIILAGHSYPPEEPLDIFF